VIVTFSADGGLVGGTADAAGEVASAGDVAAGVDAWPQAARMKLAISRILNIERILCFIVLLSPFLKIFIDGWISTPQAGTHLGDPCRCRAATTND
jgi:hypothetical protein